MMLRGFTLVELLVVIAIVSILGSTSVVVYTEYRAHAVFNTAQAEILQFIKIARQNSRTGIENDGWSVQLEENHIVLFLGDDFQMRNENYDKELKLTANLMLTGPETLTFYPVTGYPNTATSYTLKSDTNQVDLIINEYGTIEIQ